jgi:UDP:flavonoid glycosyltransferase YjiC (YdhE family)
MAGAKSMRPPGVWLIYQKTNTKRGFYMRIVAIPNAHALAHVSRLLEIAKVLRTQSHEVIFAGHGKYLDIVVKEGFTCHELPYMSVEQIVNAVRTQKLGDIYQYRQLEEFIAAESALYQQENPDLILIDNRPTARTSADKLGLPTAAVLNVHMSSFRKNPFFSLSDILGIKNSMLLTPFDLLENKIEYFLYDRLVMGDLNKLRRQMGLPGYYGNQHEEGDLSMLADIPEFNPVAFMPAHASFVDPITWHNDLPEPDSLKQLTRDRKTIYVSLGSESLDELIQELSALTELNAQVVIACGKTLGEQTCRTPVPHVFLEEFVNTDKLHPICDVVCCHGGNGTIYQALGFGLPIVAVATHAEQYVGAKKLEQLGLGRALKLTQIRKKGIKVLVKAISEVLSNPEMRIAAQYFAKKINLESGAKAAAEAIENFMKSK